MKIKSSLELKRTKRAFIVLEPVAKMPKNSGLKLFTKTWQPKRKIDEKDKEEETARPLTATLEKPTILDINFIGIIDMSTVRKEFLNISNLCRLPLSLTIAKRKKTAVISRPLSLPSPEKILRKKKKKVEESSISWREEDQTSIKSAKNSGVLSRSSVRSNCSRNGSKPKKMNDLSLVEKKIDCSDANNNSKTFKIPRKRAGNIAKLLDVGGNRPDLGGKSTKLLPEPCKTCGRPDQPERFHSHPATPLKNAKRIEEPPKMKSTVQKPVAMKYKSKQNVQNKSSTPTTARKPSLPAQKLVHTPPNLGNVSKIPTPTPPSSASRQGSASKRTLTCYICGREFGTASLPLHEPKCLQKWERENANQPIHLRRKAPPKPDHPLTQDEWNRFAWESSQAILASCTNCGRTFYPDRLAVHQRSCKMVRDANPKSLEKSPVPALKPSLIPSMPPPSVECYICKKKFGTHSIKIHEKQCLKRWQHENEALPPDMRTPAPIRPGHQSNKSDDLAQSQAEPPDRVSSSGSSASVSIKKPPMFPCYICGRLFTVNSIYIHEPQCLKMWKIENDKLPANKRRQQPLKPDIQFTQDGKIDYEATNAAKWESHLSQLVPCQFCARTFNPERVEVHEKSCKGCV